jgi:hypothetical protein
MAWEKLKQTFLGRSDKSPQSPAINWLEATGNPWGVRVLDVRPITLTMLSTSSDPQCASNAISFGRDDGTSFVGLEPPANRFVETNLRYPIDRILADGVLFVPREMEHKWALFCHHGKIICVRSWLRSVQVVARVEEHRDYVEVTAIHGMFGAEDEDPDFTARVLDYILRSHALGTVYPAPLPVGMENEPQAAAMWCMSMFGNRASFATPHQIVYHAPDKPLRTNSLLHIAVARGDVPMIEIQLAAGVPIDLLAADGLASLHWALANDDPAIMALLLERGSNVDVRSSEGATPLMNAVQSASFDKISFLLDHGADINARDLRSFTALHRAAEMGLLEVTRTLLDRGASPNLEAEGHTPRSLAEARGEADIGALLNDYDGAAA